MLKNVRIQNKKLANACREYVLAKEKTKVWPIVEQILILVLTFASITLINVPTYAWLAPFFGVAVQPLWIYKTYQLKQWGMFALSIWFLGAWSYGLFCVLF